MNKGKRIAAIIGLVLIAFMCLITLISAFFASEKAPGLFLACIFSIVVIPIMVYIFIAVYKYVHKNDAPEIKDNIDPSDNSKRG